MNQLCGYFKQEARGACNKLTEVHVSEDVKSFVKATLPRGNWSASRQRVRAFIDHGKIDTGRFGQLPYGSGDIWLNDSDRSCGRYLHGLIFLGDWPEMIEDDASGFLAKSAYEIVTRWSELFGSPSSRTHSMAYHDETTAQRLIHTLAVYPSLLGYYDEESLAPIRGLMDATASILSTEDFHATGNNHGMFQDLALRNYSILADWAPATIRSQYLDVALARLKDYFLQAFTTEGVHIENSPTYHLMVSGNLSEHVDFLSKYLHSDAELLEPLLLKAGEYAAHVTMPNGVFPPISDTQQLKLDKYVGKIYNNRHFDFAASSGSAGVEPAERVYLLPQSGYAIYRSSWRDPDATYLLFQAAYNADYHKHSDDLSMILRSGGIDIISEAGPNGYNYDDPFTKYGYSQYAHNNIVVNNRSVSRTDGLASTVNMRVDSEAPTGFSVTGTTGRLADATHTRQLIVSEVGVHPSIEVVDHLSSIQRNSYDQFWNLGQGIDAVLHERGFELFNRGRKVMDALIEASDSVSLSVHRGMSESRVLGWRFPHFGEKHPSNVIRVSSTARDFKVKTSFRLQDFHYGDTENGFDERFLIGSTPTVSFRLKKSSSKDAMRPLVIIFMSSLEKIDLSDYDKAILNTLDINILYILGPANRCEDEFDMQLASDAIQALIERTVESLALPMSMVAVAGFAEWALDAIKHGVYAGAQHVFVGANIDTEPSGGSSDTVSQGATVSTEFVESDRARLQHQVSSLRASSDISSRFHLITGAMEGSSENCLRPIAETLSASGAYVDLRVIEKIPAVELSRLVKRYFINFVNALAVSEFDSLLQSETVVSSRAVGSIDIKCRFFYGDHFLFKLYKGNEAIESTPYSTKASHSWNGLESGSYRVRVYKKNSNGVQNVGFTTPRIAIK